MKASNEEIIQLIYELKEARSSGHGRFDELITRAMQNFETEEFKKNLAREFGTARNTIVRWANKVSAPMPSVRGPVYDHIIQLLEDLLVENLAGINE